ncbi:MAG: hypothetical protein C0592_07950 [Marinilabiliales bacterium]|nr:MAG: hypothetical protein C0592_07950 [Marinilabiliales bacterium]
MRIFGLNRTQFFCIFTSFYSLTKFHCMNQEMKPCQKCRAQIASTAKFCTVCGAKQEDFVKPVEDIVNLKCICGAELMPGAKFCTKCGAKVEQGAAAISENNCVCGAELVPNAKFCTKCGKKLGVEIPKENICACGAELMPNAKFCTKCGQQIGVKPEPVMGPKKTSKKRRNRYIAAAAVLVGLLIGTYFVFFFNPGIKKELLASYEILPNDSTETVISYNDEVSISIPPGAITQKDSLHLYGVTNIDAPDFADDVVKTFDFDFQNSNSFNQEIEVTFSYKNQIAAGQSVHIMYYNEETEEWENTEALINEQNQTIRVFRTHFSSLGMVSHTTTPGPMMKVYAMKDPATMDYTNDYSKAQDIIRAYGQKKKPDDNAVKDGVDFFLTAFDITALSTDIHEQIFKFERFAKFNKLAGIVSVVKSAITIGSELGEEKYIDAIMNTTKVAASVGMTAAGWKVVAIYNVSVFLYDMYNARLEAEADEVDFKNHWADYQNFNAKTNPYRKSGLEWTQFIKDKINTSVDFEWTLDQELKKYVHAYFDINHTIDEKIQEAIMDHEMARMKEVVIKDAMLRYIQEMKDEQEREMVRSMTEMKNELNTVYTIQVIVVGKEEGSKAVRGLPVRIIVDKDQELWSGETDRNGSFDFKCTLLGYMHYGSPTKVEVDYDGKTYTGNIDFSSSNLSIVSIYIDEEVDDDQSTEEVFSFSTVAGTYTANCSDYTSFMEDETGQWIEYDDEAIDGCGHRYLEVDVDVNGNFEVIVKDTKVYDYLGPDADYCRSFYTG